MNKFPVFSFFLFVVGNVSAQLVPINSAQQCAEQFLKTPVEYVDVAFEDAKRVIKSRNFGETNEEEPAFYVFAADSQWVVVSADERTIPILAYSTECSFPSLSEMAPGMIDLLVGYQQQIQYIRNLKISDNKQQPQVKALQRSSSLPSRVAPLLERDGNPNKWKQSSNSNGTGNVSYSYNKYCPPCEDGTISVVGCVALAMSQIMWYWQWPAATYVTDYYDGYILREYDWSMMPSEITNNTPLGEIDMLTHLLADIGPAVNMNYGCENSGTFLRYVPSAFSAFGFHAEDSLLRSDFSDSEWKNMLKTELAQNRPILYASQGLFEYNIGISESVEGHCFVVDGYDAYGRFHINFGTGEQTAYFRLDNIHIDDFFGEIRYNQGHAAIFNIYPNTYDCLPIYLSKKFWDLLYIRSVRYPGGLTLYNANAWNGVTKIVSSGEYVRILPQTHFRSGSNVRISIESVDCDLDHFFTYSSSAPARRDGITESKTSLESVESIGVTIYPNPVIDKLIVSGCRSLSPELNIYSIRGQLLMKSVGVYIDVSALPTGLYILICNDEGQIAQTRFLKK